MQKPIRVLVVAPLGVGGVSSMMINIQKHLDRNKINFDYLVYHDRKEPQEEAVISLESRKLVASADDIRWKPLRRIVRMRRITRLCKEEKIDIVHFNASNAFELTNIIAAKKGGVKHITIHSHNAGYGKTNKWIVAASKLMKPKLSKYCDEFWACSDLAAKFLFPKSIIDSQKYRVIPNGIELDRYAYNPELRKLVREELGVKNNFVVGHVGRFSYQKNHNQLIDIFKAIKAKEPSAILLLFGVGELQEDIKKKVSENGLENSVRFMGASDRMSEMWQAMDVFVMPSLHEGLPVSGIEAQAAGLPCVFSDEITKEVGLTEKCKFVPLSSSSEEWAKVVLSFRGMRRTSGVPDLEKANYDIQQTADIFTDFYLNVTQKLKAKD